MQHLESEIQIPGNPDFGQIRFSVVEMFWKFEFNEKLVGLF